MTKSRRPSKRLFERPLARSRSVQGEHCFRRRDGAAVWCLVYAKAVDSAGEDAGSIWVFDDITARLELDRLREDVERMMRHDLKAPLNAVINFPELVLDEGEVNATQAEYLRYIQEAGRRMLFQINMSLDLYKMETGTYRVEPQPLDLRPVVRVAVRDLSAMARDHQVRVEATADGLSLDQAAPVRAMADQALCHSILANLLQNAIEASPAGGVVEVLLSEYQGQAVVAVRNQGEVPAEFVPVFFDKYSTRGKKQGNGLGTYSARLMTEIQGGRVELTSGEGKTGMTVSLPLAGA